MNGPVWSLRTLLFAVVLTGLFLGALRYPHFACAEAASSISLITLAFAVLAAILRRGEARHFWIGASLFGLGYLFFILRIDNVTDGGPFPRRLLS